MPLIDKSTRFQPFVCAATAVDESSTVDAVFEDVHEALREAKELEVVGHYTPEGKTEVKIISVTTNGVTEGIQSVGGLTGFALGGSRVAICKDNDGKVSVTFSNPMYMLFAYFSKSAHNESLQSRFQHLYDELTTAIGRCDSLELVGESFGRKDKGGIKVKDLGKWHYMVGMPYFNEPLTAGKFDSHEQALEIIDKKLQDSDQHTLVYKVSIDDHEGTKLTCYGIGLSHEADYMPIIDIGPRRAMAHLPYELLIIDNKAKLLHGRYRIAISFPSLTMKTFSKIMDTPGTIENSMKALCTA